jgi:hypothetical protein
LCRPVWVVCARMRRHEATGTCGPPERPCREMAHALKTYVRSEAGF